MAGLIDRLGRTLLYQFDPETAHHLAIRGLSLNLHRAAASPDPRLATRVLGLDFPSPIGLAAGFDKNAVAFDGILKLGFGFVEIGTVTPRPQPGNPKPRMFRLERDQAIINRLGFNNDGLEAVAARLAGRRGSGIVGVNIGANKDSADRIADYLVGIDRLARSASYLAINVSSPNTPGLRSLQERGLLDELLGRAVAARDEATNGGRSTPLLVKIAPDLGDREIEDVAASVKVAGIDGVIATNTTLSRTGLRDAGQGGEAGGLSGRPLFLRSTIVLGRLRQSLGQAITLIGVGGVDSGKAAFNKLAAGANLVEVYSGMIFEGQGIATAINRDLALRLDAGRHASIADIVGSDMARWAAMDLPPA